jgi:(4-O-methyl)-D-glucuronate---lignin esterase
VPRPCWVAGLCMLGSAGLALAQSTSEQLPALFQSPPGAARPSVGLILAPAQTQERIRRQLDWMKQVGIANTMIDETAFGAAEASKDRLVYMSHEWTDAFRYAVEQAAVRDIGVGIFTSAGWSESGSPHVTPREAMKKLVWSETAVRGAQPFKGKLPPPPPTTGPFQDIESPPFVFPGISSSTQTFYADTAVVAYRTPDRGTRTTPSSITSSAGPIDVGLLTDGKLRESFSLPLVNKTAWVQLTYEQPQTIRTAVLGTPLPVDYLTASVRTVLVEVQAQTRGGSWQTVARTEVGSVPQATVSFAPTTARAFRVVFSASPWKTLGRLMEALPSPGADMSLLANDLTSPQSFALSELSLQPVGRVNEFELKSGFAAASDYYALATPSKAANVIVPTADVVDLTGRMRPDGTLEWSPPPGRWVILRLGYSLTGKTNHPAPPEATGLEVDKLNRGYVQHYMTDYLEQYLKILPPSLVGERGLRTVMADSIESGPQNWTDDMLSEFERLRGYDPRPYLPALTGVIVQSTAASDRFLWDFRRTLAQLVAESHYAELAERVHAHGLSHAAEALEWGRPQLGDDLQMRRYADVPMGAMWTHSPGLQPWAPFIADLRGAASVAHLYGKAVVGVESFTNIVAPRAFSPRDLKPLADLMFALGANQFGWPGVDLGDTWAQEAQPWISYLSRSSYLLQQGRYVADVAYFYGEDAPTVGLAGQGQLDDTPEAYAFDFIDAASIVNLLSVKDGCLATPSGMCYRALKLGGSSAHMTLPVLRKIRELVDNGAIVVGEAPIDSPSLADDEATFRRIKTELWGPQGQGAKLGRGRVYGGRSADEALAARGIAPDVTYTHPHEDTQLLFLHRTLPDGDIYFLSNRRSRQETLNVTFRVAGKLPELWHAETGRMVPASFSIRDGQTMVPLTLQPDEAVFVVFRKPAQVTSRDIPEPARQILSVINGPWRLQFQADRGAPAQVSWDSLGSWSDSVDSGIRYFSGTATYTKTLSASESWFQPGTHLILDLGEVGDVVDVSINGKPLGTLWNAPYVEDISGVLHPGQNELVVRVTNLWVNRMIGDKQPGAVEYSHSTGPTYLPGAPLRRSGLLGPVRIIRLTAPAAL